MVVFGYTKDYYYTGDGTLLIKVRIPTIHGPYTQAGYNGKVVRNYVSDSDLPYYPAMLLPHLPAEGEVAVLAPTNLGNNQFIVIGLTGGSYSAGVTNIGG